MGRVQQVGCSEVNENKEAFQEEWISVLFARAMVEDHKSAIFLGERLRQVIRYEPKHSYKCGYIRRSFKEDTHHAYDCTNLSTLNADIINVIDCWQLFKDQFHEELYCSKFKYVNQFIDCKNRNKYS